MTRDHLRIGVVSLRASLEDGPPVLEDTVNDGVAIVVEGRLVCWTYKWLLLEND